MNRHTGNNHDGERTALLGRLVQVGDNGENDHHHHHVEQVDVPTSKIALQVQCGTSRGAVPARWRITVVVLLMFCNVSLYLSRANISIAALYMFKECPNWQKWVLAAFYLGYSSSLILAGHLASKFGGKSVLFGGVCLWSVATFLCVPAFNANPQAPVLLVVCRVVIGFAEGCNYPSQVALVGKWLPASERTTAWTCLTIGEALGTVLAMLTSPYLATWGGWPMIFYVSGGVGGVWLVLFTVFVTKSPETHWGISNSELQYILSTRPQPFQDGEMAPSFCNVPWRAFFGLPAFWATVTAHFCYNYMSFLALSLGPFFFRTKYNVDISKPSSGLGFFACLPYVVLFAAQLPAGWLADRLHNKGVLAMTSVRKLFNTLGMVAATVFFGILGSPIVQDGPSDHNGLTIAMVFLTIAVGVGGVAIVGHWANYYDLSAKYGPLMLGIGTTIATVPGMITNIVSGEILDEIHRNKEKTSEAWASVFLITAGVSLVGGIVFACFASATQVDFDAIQSKRKSRSALAPL
eukprot:m.43180 g.43180  ORF g.43180 m.43180 type:complete len:521 (-) comp19315_c1_seq1:69-1631(-)